MNRPRWEIALTSDTPGPETILHRLRWPLRLTHAGMVAERAWRAFWPLVSVVMAVLAALMLGLHDLVAIELVWTLGAVAGVAALGALGWGARRFRWPSRTQALARLDSTLKGHPISAVLDAQAVGAGDAASRAVWEAHQRRMAERTRQARPVTPDLRVARHDPYALRYAAALALAVALVFGSVWRIGSVADLTPGGASAAAGPSWEGWVEPPRHTGLPTVYLADARGDELEVPVGSRILLRFYGKVGDLSLSETVSGQPPAPEAAQGVEHDLTVARNGELRIDGPGGRGWRVVAIPDDAPRVTVAGAATTRANGEFVLPFAAADDYGVVAGRAVVTLDLAAVDRRYGLAAAPDPRAPVTLDLPMPITGDRRAFEEKLVEDFSQHPWANLPVTVTLSVVDAAGQEGRSAPFATRLAARRFFDPLAAAVAEQRRDLLWARANAPRVAQILRAVSHRPDEIFRKETDYMRLRFIVRRLETFTRYGLKPEQQAEIAQALWDLAIRLEEGDLGDALERMRRAQERLEQAMKNGASDQEIARLMDELRRATEDYMRQLSRQARQDRQQQDGQQQGDTLQMTQEDLQRMMDRIQELMEQGRMAEAMEALREFQQMMENMRVTQGQGQQGDSEGDQAMQGLAETLRRQQGLSDQAFRDLQEQFNEGAQSGQSSQNQGRNGGEGRGQGHEGQNGEGQGSEGQGGGQGDRQADRGGQGSEEQGSLADRQRALRDELRRQQEGLPGLGAEGDAARNSLDRAGRAMREAEDALRRDDLPGAIDRQAEAMEALREGMRSLGEALARNQPDRQGQGNSQTARGGQNRDPLGRSIGSTGALGTDEGLLQGEDVYRRARELLDEIRRRAGEGTRPRIERDYLKRLLDQFGGPGGP